MSVNFSAATVLPTGQNSNSVAVADVNGDGNLDIVTGGSSTIPGSFFETGGISTLLGDGIGFKPAISTTPGNQFGSSRSLALGDFNNDKRPDLITTGSLFGNTANNIFVALGDGKGNFTPTTSLSIGNDPRSVVVGDIDQDGNLDAVTANTTAKTASILLGDGTGKFKTPINLSLDGNVQAVALQDFSGDGKLDLLALTAAPSGDNAKTTLSFLLGDGKGGFTPDPAIDLNSPVSSNSDLAVADFNGNGGLDVATLAGNKLSILLADGSTQRFQLVFQTELAANSLTAGDFNGDGRTDLLADVDSGRSAAVLLGNGAGGFSRPITFTTFNQSGISENAVGDFNKDNKTDLATTSSSLKAAAVLINSTTVNDALAQGLAADVSYIDASSELGGSIKVDLQKGTFVLNTPTRLTQSARGIDDVIGTVFDDKITGSKRKNLLNGYAGNDELLGGDGADRLIGGAGKDEITTGGGKDRCIFTATPNYPEGLEVAYNKQLLGVDRLTDFDRKRDKIVLDTGTFTELTFNKKVRFDRVNDLAEAKESKGIITYIADSGKLYYNANGAKNGFGGGGLFAILENQTALTAKNFAAFE